ncbi:MAG: TIGR01777 family protein [Opitutus sp.]|nr:TIGR01777 family protein [Opitutus sp.]
MIGETFSLTTRIARPAAEVFAWHERAGALARLCPPWERVEIVAATGGVRDGARVTVRNKFGPLWLNWRMEHRDYVAGRQFRDVQLSGPFAAWEHLHRVEPDEAGACRLTDEISYRLPGGALGRAVAGGFVRRELQRLFHWRHAVTKADVELAAQYQRMRARRVLIAGASGLVGRTLVAFLQTQGHSVVRLVRREATGEGEVAWNPATGELDPGAIEGVDAIVNLSGENVGAGRWTAARREAILRSRVDATRTLVVALQKLRRKPEVFVSASAVGFYGEGGEEVLDEKSPIGLGFLPGICLAWETHAEGAARAGVRTVLMRFGVVLTPAGGALAKMLPVFRAGLGGRIGTEHQWMSWISADDAVGALHHAIVEPRCRGPMNVVAPEAVTNRTFAATLGRVLRRPAIFPVPAVALRALFGEMADGTLLASTRVHPRRLVGTGYVYRQPTLEGALRHTLGEGNNA